MHHHVSGKLWCTTWAGATAVGPHPSFDPPAEQGAELRLLPGPHIHNCANRRGNGAGRYELPRVQRLGLFFLFLSCLVHATCCRGRCEVVVLHSLSSGQDVLPSGILLALQKGSKITEWSGLEGTSVGHPVQPPCRSRVSYSRLHRTLSRWVLNISRERKFPCIPQKCAKCCEKKHFQRVPQPVQARGVRRSRLVVQRCQIKGWVRKNGLARSRSAQVKVVSWHLVWPSSAWPLARGVS